MEPKTKKILQGTATSLVAVAVIGGSLAYRAHTIEQAKNDSYQLANGSNKSKKSEVKKEAGKSSSTDEAANVKINEDESKFKSAGNTSAEWDLRNAIKTSKKSYDSSDTSVYKQIENEEQARDLAEEESLVHTNLRDNGRIEDEVYNSAKDQAAIAFTKLREAFVKLQSEMKTSSAGQQSEQILEPVYREYFNSESDQISYLMQVMSVLDGNIDTSNFRMAKSTNDGVEAFDGVLKDSSGKQVAFVTGWYLEPTKSFSVQKVVILPDGKDQLNAALAKPQ